MRRTLIAAALGAGLAMPAGAEMLAWFWDNDVWSGYVYPDADNLKKDRFVGEFSTLESCRQACLDVLENNDWNNADYACGLNCRSWEGAGLNICEQTLR